MKERLLELEELVQRVLPNLGFELAPSYGRMSLNELRRLLTLIKRQRLIEDGLEVLNSFSIRKSVSYVLEGKGVEKEATFEMIESAHSSPAPYGVLGNIYTYKKNGSKVNQLALHNLHLPRK